MKDFSELIELVRRTRKHSPWNRAQTLKSFHENLQAEVTEVSEAISKKDYSNLKKS